MGKQPGWNDVKRAVSQLGQKDAIALIHDLFKLSTKNRDYLLSRFASLPREVLLPAYLKRMVEPFYPARGGIGDLQFADARAAIKEYEQATHDVQGVLDQMLPSWKTEMP